MGRQKFPVTPAIRALRAAGAAYEEHLYDYVPNGGTAASAAALDVPEHHVIKTLVMEDEARQPLIILMHGDRSVSTKSLARQIGRKTVDPCATAVAQKHTGYQVGGTSPFGLRKPVPVYWEASIAELPWIVINGGKRGFLLRMDPAVVKQVLSPTAVQVAN